LNLRNFHNLDCMLRYAIVYRSMLLAVYGNHARFNAQWIMLKPSCKTG